MALREVLGQERAKRFLNRLLHLGKVPHALLLTGMRGIGKTALAHEFAALLNCSNPVSSDACDSCASCRKMKDGHHPDLLRVRSDGAFIKIEQIRILKQRAAFRPFEGKWRVVIVEDAQNLREEAGNALLKLLEEPPKQNVFILTALEPQMLLPTVVSRCCHIRLQPLEQSTVAHHLTTTLGLHPSHAQRIAVLAEGSLDRARLLAQPERMAHLNEILGNVTRLRDLPMVDFFPFAAQWAKDSEDLEQDLECIKLWIRDLVLSSLLADHTPMMQVEDCSTKRSEKASIECLMSLFVEIEKAHLHIRQNANKQLTLEGVCLAIKENLYGESRWYSISQGRKDLSF